MTYVPEPISLTQGAQLVLVDYPDDFEQVAKVANDGTATITTDTVPLGYYWRAERMTTVVSNTVDGQPLNTPSGATLSIYKSSGASTRPIKYRDGTAAPGLDVADESQPIIVQGGYALTFLWTNLTPGTYAAVSLQYALLRRMNGSG
ncbi:MAG: hypothetical protein HOY79_49760 [Streptomyces sp.]|nr:hypothetical protein [Streptomyces sp.]